MAEKRRKIIVVGGGTGIGPVLEGLRSQGAELIAVVPSTDRGGSSRTMLDEKLTVLPPGDTAKALIAMSDAHDALLKLLKFRFDGDSKLKGDSISNILAAAAEAIAGDSNGSWDFLRDVFRIEGTVRQSSLSRNTELCIKRKNGVITVGEDKIDEQRNPDAPDIVDVFLDPPTKLNPSLRDEFASADAIVFAPGSWTTSVRANLAVDGFVEAIGSSPARILLVSNLVNEAGHTTGWTAHRYATELNQLIAPRRLDVLIANNGTPSAEVMQRYQTEGGDLTELGQEPADPSYEMVAANLMSDETVERQAGDTVKHRSLIRHDADKVARRIMLALE